MIEVTVLRGDGAPFAFRFENDDLQAFLAKEAAEGVVCKVTSLIALGVPIAATKPAAKTAGPGAARDAVERAKAERDAADKAIASKRAADAEAKAKAEKK